MYVLTQQLHSDGDAGDPFQRYFKYLKRNESRIPTSAYRFATGPMLSASNKSCPHDGWLEWARFEEPAKGKNHQIRHLSLRIRLLGAYHDRFIEMFYPKVYSYAFSNPSSSRGHFDWRYSEIRLNKSGNIIHEIEWCGPPGANAHWIIEASDVRHRSVRLDRA